MKQARTTNMIAVKAIVIAISPVTK